MVCRTVFARSSRAQLLGIPNAGDSGHRRLPGSHSSWSGFAALGEQIVAVGGNEEAARLSGINIDRVKIIVYTLSGLLSSLAGFVLIARIGAAEPIGGNGFELQAIGAAVIGGASLFGGVGNPLGSLDRRAHARRPCRMA